MKNRNSPPFPPSKKRCPADDPGRAPRPFPGASFFPVKNGVAAELAKLTAHDPSWSWAVVFGTTWHPVTPPAGEQWDYDPFTARAEAERRMGDPRSERFAEPELWERGEGRWEQVA